MTSKNGYLIKSRRKLMDSKGRRRRGEKDEEVRIFKWIDEKEEKNEEVVLLTEHKKRGNFWSLLAKFISFIASIFWWRNFERSKKVP